MTTIFVQSTRDDNRVVLYEQHPKHPGGEAFVAGKSRNKLKADGRPVLRNGTPVLEDNVVEVFPSARVNQLLGNGPLVKVEPKKSSGSKAATTSGDSKK